jgi:hypothetical protein
LATVHAEWLIPERFWRRWFGGWRHAVVWPDTVRWQDGAPMSADERAKVLQVLQNAAAKRKMRLEFEAE